jgi:hypothetical protein
LTNLSALIELNLPDRRRGAPRQRGKDTPEPGILGQQRFGQRVLLLSALAFDKRNPLLLTPPFQFQLVTGCAPPSAPFVLPPVFQPSAKLEGEQTYP